MNQDDWHKYFSSTTAPITLSFNDSDVEIHVERFEEKESAVKNQSIRLDEIEENLESIKDRLDFLSDVIVTTTIATTATMITTTGSRKRRSMNDFEFRFLDNVEIIEQEFRYISYNRYFDLKETSAQWRFAILLHWVAQKLQ